MQPGFNHDVSHRGRSFHVQTEDLGRERPVIVTHLFSGGQVVASSRTEYGEWLECADLAQRVQGLMREQHKQMLRRLAHGAYDGTGS